MVIEKFYQPGYAMDKRKEKAIIVILSFTIFLAGFFPERINSDNSGENPRHQYSQYEQLLQRAINEGAVKVIAKLWVPNIEKLIEDSNNYFTAPPGQEFPLEGVFADERLQNEINLVAGYVLERLTGHTFKVNHIYVSIPYMALDVSAETLALLQSLPEILDIEQDVPYSLIEPVENLKVAAKGSSQVTDRVRPALFNTVDVIGATEAWNMGFTGSGWYVAVLDTGIRRTHDFFQGKNIVEACFAQGEYFSGDCPNGNSTMTGTGSAAHHSSAYLGWDHGTHVTGIATGNNGSLFGVAKDADIIAVQVFSRFADCYPDPGSQPCVMTWNSDSLAGLDYVYSIRGSYSISSVNMSLGGESYSSACDSDSRKAAIDNLRAAGIATAIATGNNGYCGSISSPACISSSIAVGSSTDSDAESGFNNWHPTMQKLFAPGSVVYSSTGDSDSSYESWNGTSMATPHVAGSWAILKQATPASTVGQILSMLQSTGIGITSICDGYAIPIPRIQIDAALLTLPNSLTVTSPNGGETVCVGSLLQITWTSEGTVGDVRIEYSINSGTNWTDIVLSTPNDGSYAWTIPNTPSSECLIRVSEAADSNPSDTSDATFSIINISPGIPSNPTPNDGAKDVSTTADLNWNDSIGATAYDVYFDTSSPPNLYGSTTESNFGLPQLQHGTTYYWKIDANNICGSTPGPEWQFITESIDTTPSSYQVLPEAIWAPATGGGNWVTEAQITDLTGGSQVSVYFNYGGGNRKGPFLLWTSSGLNRSVKYSNLLANIDGLDSEVFTYYGRVGSVEFFTQDTGHKIQINSRILNGDYSKTCPGLNDIETNSANTARPMMIQNLVNNTTYRAAVGLFNPTSDSVTAELRLIDAQNNTIGSEFSRILVGYDFQSFFPFDEAGVPHPSYSYDNVFFQVNPTSGTGKVMCFGATANNITNDPAAHFAAQYLPGFDTSPSSYQVLPEVIWAPATGSGTWVTEVQITDRTGGSQVSVYFNSNGNRQGPFTIWSSSGLNRSIKFSNLLETIDSVDPDTFVYYGLVGAVEFITQDTNHKIQVTARTLNGNYSKTFPGLNDVMANTCDTSRQMMIQDLISNTTYRSAMGCFNPSSDSVTVEYRLIDANGNLIGSTFTKSYAGYGFQSFFPFNEAGRPYPAYSYDNMFIQITPTSGSGKIMCFGASANNNTNDPAAHLGVIKEYQP